MFDPPSVVKRAKLHSDSAAKQILLHVDSGREGPSKFILRDGESQIYIHSFTY